MINIIYEIETGQIRWVTDSAPDVSDPTLAYIKHGEQIDPNNYQVLNGELVNIPPPVPIELLDAKFKTAIKARLEELSIYTSNPLLIESQADLDTYTIALKDLIKKPDRLIQKIPDKPTWML